MCTCSLLELICQSPEGLWWGYAAVADEGLLPRLPLPVPSLLPAPEASGSGSAGSHEQGPHLGKGQETLRKVPLPGGWRWFCPPTQRYNANPLKQSKT